MKEVASQVLSQVASLAGGVQSATVHVGEHQRRHRWRRLVQDLKKKQVTVIGVTSAWFAAMEERYVSP
jgi:hypothetical protein